MFIADKCASTSVVTPIRYRLQNAPTAPLSLSTLCVITTQRQLLRSSPGYSSAVELIIYSGSLQGICPFICLLTRMSKITTARQRDV